MSEKTESELLALFKNGDKEAADELLGRYFDRVVRAAHRRIAQRRLRGTDSEDVALSVFESLWKKADNNHFDENDLTRPDEFWRLICTMIRFKTEDHLRRENSAKRGGGEVRGQSVFGNPDNSVGFGIEGHRDQELTPDEDAAFRDQLNRLLTVLDDETLKVVVSLRMEEYKVAEIAQHFGKSDRWVKRQLALIRHIWNEVLENESKD